MPWPHSTACTGKLCSLWRLGSGLGDAGKRKRVDLCDGVMRGPGAQRECGGTVLAVTGQLGEGDSFQLQECLWRERDKERSYDLAHICSEQGYTCIWKYLVYASLHRLACRWQFYSQGDRSL